MSKEKALNVAEHLDRLEELSATLDLIDSKRTSLFTVEQKIKNLQKDKKGIEAEIEKLELKAIELNDIFKGKSFRSTQDQPGLFDVVAGKENAVIVEHSDISKPTTFLITDEYVSLFHGSDELKTSMEKIVGVMLNQTADQFETMDQLNNAGSICLEGSNEEQLFSLFVELFTKNHSAVLLREGLIEISMDGGTKEINGDAETLEAFSRLSHPIDIYRFYTQPEAKTRETESVANAKAFAEKLPQVEEVEEVEEVTGSVDTDNKVKIQNLPIEFIVEEKEDESVILKGMFEKDKQEQRKVSRLIAKSFLKKFEYASLIEANYNELLEIWEDPGVNFTDIDPKPEAKKARLKKQNKAIPYEEVEV